MLVANFKSNKTPGEVNSWLDGFCRNLASEGGLPIILCPQAHAIGTSKVYLEQNNCQHNILLGAQDISAFGVGAYTGEIAAESINELISYTLVGHSERRKLLNESAEDVQKKVSEALKYGITPIVCISEETLTEVAVFPDNVVIAYEPLSAIGSGVPATPEQTSDMIKQILQIRQKPATIIYGGSVTAPAVPQLLAVEGIKGFLVGSASLDPKQFFEIYNAIRQYREGSVA